MIKIEATQRVDGWRGGLAGHTGSGRIYETSPLFNALNRNKLGITLNLACPEGIAIFQRLLGVSDMVCENYSSRVMGNLGIDYPSLRKLRPDIIMVSLSGFRRSGPWRDYIAFAATVESMAGLLGLTGYPGGPPLTAGTILGDPLPALFSAYAAVSALEYRLRCWKLSVPDALRVAEVTITPRWHPTTLIDVGERTSGLPLRWRRTRNGRCYAIFLSSPIFRHTRAMRPPGRGGGMQRSCGPLLKNGRCVVPSSKWPAFSARRVLLRPRYRIRQTCSGTLISKTGNFSSIWTEGRWADIHIRLRQLFLT